MVESLSPVRRGHTIIVSVALLDALVEGFRHVQHQVNFLTSVDMQFGRGGSCSRLTVVTDEAPFVSVW